MENDFLRGKLMENEVFKGKSNGRPRFFRRNLGNYGCLGENP